MFELWYINDTLSKYTDSHQASVKQLSDNHKAVIRQSLNVVDFCHHAEQDQILKIAL